LTGKSKNIENYRINGADTIKDNNITGPTSSSNTANSSHFKAELILLGVVVIWGYTFPLVKNVMELIPPFTFLAYRFLLASLTIYLIFQKQLRNINLDTLKKGFLLGFFLFIGYFGQTTGTQYTTATKTAFITGFSVVLVPIFAFFIIREKIHFNSIIGVIMAIIGLWAMNSRASLTHFNKGDALVSLCAVFFALHIVFVDVFTKKYDYVQLVFVQLFTVFLCSLTMSFLLEKEALHISYHWPVWWAIIFAGLFATAMAIYLQNRFQRHSSPTKIAIIFSSEPAFGAFFSWLIMGETIGLVGIMGGLIIFAGMIIAQLSKVET
jgi:drug/metabolite transporter (DMT)-like permease